MSLLENAQEFFFDKVAPVVAMGFIGLATLAFVIGIPFAVYAFYKESQSPTFELRKDEWTCSASVERQSTTYVQSGNVMVPITNYYNHCTQWSELP